jgi:predicted PurR-regulated permease PerM
VTSPERFDFSQRTLVAVLIAAAIGALAILVWYVSNVLLLIFGAILIATILRAVGDLISRSTPLSPKAALPFALLLVIAVVGAVVWLFHAQIRTELIAAVQAAQNALPGVGQRLGLPDLPDDAAQIIAQLVQSAAHSGVLGTVTSVGTTALRILTNFFIVVFGGMYLALKPSLYRDGFVKLFPANVRDQLRQTLDIAGGALKRWLLGQVLAMIITGGMTWFALWIIGVPAAVGLALIAGFAEFIPVLGPFLGAVPALLIAFSQDLTTAAWTALAFVIVQQIESNLIQPIIARESVALPPAVLLFSVVMLGVLFGVLGVLFAAPLTVVIFVALKKLYIRDILGEKTDIPGETQK